VLEAYLNQNKPLTAFVGSQNFTLKNLNSLTILELKEAVEAVEKDQKYGTLLRSIVLEDENDVLSGLSKFKSRKIVEAWESHAGVKLTEVLQVFHIVENYWLELQSDLSNFTNLKTVTELLTLSALDIVTVTSSLLQHTNRKSFIVSKVQNLQQPFSPENNSELLLWTAVNILRAFGQKDSIPLETFMLKTDNQNSDFKPLKEVPNMTPEQAKRRAERLAQWRQNGNLD
jgi:hypothetical protein